MLAADPGVLHGIRRSGYDHVMTNHDQSSEPTTDDPRLQEPEGDEGIPAPLLDTPQNIPGDQPVDDTPPSRTKATGDA